MNISMLLNKIQETEHLRKGWDSYNTDPPNHTARNNAKEMVRLLEYLDVHPTHVCVSVEGGIEISIRKEKEYTSIECFNDGVIIVGKIKGNKELTPRCKVLSCLEIKLSRLI